MRLSYCRCQWGWGITIIDYGQKDFGKVDLSRNKRICLNQKCKQGDLQKLANKLYDNDLTIRDKEDKAEFIEKQFIEDFNS